MKLVSSSFWTNCPLSLSLSRSLSLSSKPLVGSLGSQVSQDLFSFRACWALGLLGITSTSKKLLDYTAFLDLNQKEQHLDVMLFNRSVWRFIGHSLPPCISATWRETVKGTSGCVLFVTSCGLVRCGRQRAVMQVMDPHGAEPALRNNSRFPPPWRPQHPVLS